MKQTLKLFQIGLRQIRRDGMLLILLPVPLLVGLIFKFAVPYANAVLEEHFSLLPWYSLIDGMLVCLTPMFVAMISAFLLLEERDEGIGAYYQITPAADHAYLTARIGIPMGWAFAVTIIITVIFQISGLSLMTILSSSLISALTGIFMAMMVVSIAGNRVEGLAVSKLMGVSFLGLLLVWFVPAPYSYFAAFLPSFWIGAIIIDGVSLFKFICGILICLFWITCFTKRFLRKTG